MTASGLLEHLVGPAVIAGGTAVFLFAPIVPYGPADDPSKYVSLYSQLVSNVDWWALFELYPWLLLFALVPVIGFLVTLYMGL